MRSMTPGRKGSIITSDCVMSFRASASPLGVLQETEIERFPLQSTSEDDETSGLSTRITEAPLSARIRPQKGPGANPPN